MGQRERRLPLARYVFTRTHRESGCVHARVVITSLRAKLPPCENPLARTVIEAQTYEDALTAYSEEEGCELIIQRARAA